MSAPIGLIAVLAVFAVFCIAQGQASTCHSCSGQACLRTSQVNVTKVCTVTSDPCVASFDGFVPTKKGCYSDLTAAEKTVCDDSGNVACYKCSGDRCNHLGRVDHKCKSCIATSSNSTCLFAPTIVPDTRCTAPRTQDVYCSVSYEGNTTIRGCITSNRDIVNCLATPAKCSMCTVSPDGGCNQLEFPAGRRQCQYCSDSNCQLTNTTTTSAVLRTCPNAADRCVSVNYNSTVHRTCAMELAVEVRDFCVAHNTSCVYCSTNGCNVAIPPSVGGGAANVALNVAMLAVALVASVMWGTSANA